MAKVKLPPNHILKRLEEDFFHVDGVLYIKEKRWGHVRKAGGLDKNGYHRVRLGGRMLFTHRIILYLETGTWPMDEVDHINGVRDDNRPSNLRLVSKSQNNRGFKTKAKNTTSKYRGVSFKTKTNLWRACITVTNRHSHIGYFKSEEEAARAYNEAAIEMGFFPEALNKLD
jgi:hypothetical protein